MLKLAMLWKKNLKWLLVTALKMGTLFFKAALIDIPHLYLYSYFSKGQSNGHPSLIDLSF
jgi:hypothetical protein